MRTPITYYGGKQNMLDLILPKIPKHKIYVEPFFGGGAVFFAKNPSYLEVINDKNDRLITFYEEMRDNFDELQNMISDTLYSEVLHMKAKDIYNGRINASKLETAWSVWVLTNMSFSASIHGGWKWCNGTGGTHSAKVVHKKAHEFKKLKTRLSNVQISKRDAIKVIQERDTPETFFYLDPPYPGHVQGHYHGYSMKEFFQLLEVLQNLRGKFMLSNFWNQTLKYFTIKNNWNTDKHDFIMKVANFQGTRFKSEILISNYNIEQNLFSVLNNQTINKN